MTKLSNSHIFLEAHREGAIETGVGESSLGNGQVCNRSMFRVSFAWVINIKFELHFMFLRTVGSATHKELCNP